MGNLYVYRNPSTTSYCTIRSWKNEKMTEFEFGLIAGELRSTGLIADDDDRHGFVQVAETLRRLLNAYVYTSSEDDKFNDDRFTRDWDDIKHNIGIGTLEGTAIVDIILEMYSQASEADEDDAFGSSGFQTMVFN